MACQNASVLKHVRNALFLNADGFLLLSGVTSEDVSEVVHAKPFKRPFMHAKASLFNECVCILIASVCLVSDARMRLFSQCNALSNPTCNANSQQFLCKSSAVQYSLV